MIFLKSIIILSVCCAVLAEINSAIENEVEGRKNHKHKHHFPYKVLLFHYIHGAIIVLVIIKIVLAMTLVGMITGLMKLFAAFKFIFQETASKNNDQAKIIVPQYHPSHDNIEYEIPGSTDFDGYHHRRKGDNTRNRGAVLNPRDKLYSAVGLKPYYNNANYYGINPRQDMTGGRNLGINAAYSAQIKENVGRARRHLNENNMSNYANNVVKQRTIRSSKAVDTNCMKRRACLLHARIRQYPIFTFNLYFIKKHGLAQYWDHDESKTAEDCLRVFPCHYDHKTPEGNNKTAEQSKVTQDLNNNVSDQSGEDDDIEDESSEIENSIDTFKPED